MEVKYNHVESASDAPLSPECPPLEKSVSVKVTLVVRFEAASLDDIAEIKDVIDEAVDVLNGEGEMIESECKEEITTT